jgi:hypothetical protein
MASPALHPNAAANAGWCDKDPATRQRGGECGSETANTRACSSLTLLRQTCANETKKRYSGVSPSMARDGFRAAAF